jgi:hypothetical protein
MITKLPKPTIVRNKVDVAIRGLNDACEEIQRLIDRVATYRAQGDSAKPLLAEAVADVRSTPARRRLVRHFDALEAWATEVETYERNRTRRAVA